MANGKEPALTEMLQITILMQEGTGNLLANMRANAALAGKPIEVHRVALSCVQAAMTFCTQAEQAQPSPIIQAPKLVLPN